MPARSGEVGAGGAEERQQPSKVGKRCTRKALGINEGRPREDKRKPGGG